MKNKMAFLKQSLGVMMTIAMVFLYALSPVVVPKMIDGSEAYAANGGVFIESIGSPGGSQGDSKISVGFEITNNRSETVVVQNMKLSIDGSGVTVQDNTGSITITPDGKQTISFTVKVDKKAATGEKNCSFRANLKDLGGSDLTNQKTLELNTYFTVYERMATDGNDSKTVAAIDITHKITPSTGFVQGNDNKLSVEFYSFGNSVVKNARAVITLPDGLSVYNGSNQVDLGYISTGTRKTAEFPITVKEGMESRNYPIEVSLTGVNFMNGDVVAKKTFYIPVEGEGEVSSDNINITNVNIPEQMTAGQPFNLNFTVQNTGNRAIKNVKINVEPPEGVINKSKNIFIDNFAKGESKNYSVKLYTFEGAEEKSYPIKISASTANGGEKESAAISQYATVTILSDGKTAKKPQLMVDNYSYGGSAVQAGTDFYLNLGIFNTSAKSLSNIKVSLKDEDGVFVPVGGSNAFFVDSIAPKARYTKSIRMSTKPQAEQKTTAINVAITYEDGSGNPLESADIISIPVTQRTRLAVDDIVPPMEVYVGQPGTCELEFYNMGKTPLSNLRVNCTGNFDVMESNSYYAGNMESGKSDSYRFSFIPREVGKMDGTITFTFEDANGDPQFLEVPFTFEVMEMPEWEEENPGEDVQQKKTPWALIISGAVIAAGAIGIILFKRHRKKKLHDALYIEDDYEMEIGEDTDENKNPTEK
ncbi:MAG: COG1361 S-layer family protein [Aminipila sp.]